MFVVVLCFGAVWYLVTDLGVLVLFYLWVACFWLVGHFAWMLWWVVVVGCC